LSDPVLISGADIHERGVIPKDFGDAMAFDEINQTFMNKRIRALVA
jgi:hypothetical protein